MALSRVALVELDEAVVQAAAAIEPTELRTLDAIHLARAPRSAKISEPCVPMTPTSRMQRQLQARRSWRQSEALRLIRVGGVSHNRQGPLGPLTAWDQLLSSSGL
jgi:hypothetical protein